MNFRQQRVGLSKTFASARRLYSFAHTVSSSDLRLFLQNYSPPIPTRSNIASTAPSVTVYTLPQETASLRELVPLLQEKFPNSIGCLSSSFEERSDGKETVSIAHFWDTDRTTYRLFRSAEQGKEPASVGRWRPLSETMDSLGAMGEMKGQEEGNALERAVKGGDWSNVWEEWKKDSNREERTDGQILNLEGLESVDSTRIAMALLFSTPTSLSPTLDLFPSSSPTAGLVVPQTPFTTGRPHTLFYKNQTYEQGAVGLAVLSEKVLDEGRTERVKMEVEWEGMEPVEDQIYEVVSSQGNLLLSMSPCATDPAPTISNPTKHLIALLQGSPSAKFDHKSYLGSKEKEFFLGFVRSGGPELGVTPSGSNKTENGGSMRDVKRVVRLLSGDPARGGMAIEREDSLQIGERFMFVHRPDEITNQGPNSAASCLTSHTFAFRTPSSSSSLLSSEANGSLKSKSDLTRNQDESSGLHTSIEGFDSSSEAGFIVRLPTKSDERDLSGETNRGFADKGIEGGRVVIRLDE